MAIDFMKTYQEHFTSVETYIRNLKYPSSPANLYEPVSYMLSLGGKRIRPVLVMMADDMFGGTGEHAIHAAVAVEMFHNFTLVHDDIMDKAPLRRGQATVHEKWNQTVAILSGDLMMVKATELLCNSESDRLKELLTVFNKAATEVCEGQQIDMDFESRDDVSVEEYLQMITLKTAVLLGASLELGALVAGASKEDAAHLYAFGKNIGIAFQIQDDMLDSFGDGDQVGKKIGGDIAANKKTLLLIEALKLADETTLVSLQQWLRKENSSNDKVDAVLGIYEKLGVRAEAERLKQHYLQEAFLHLDAVAVPDERKTVLRSTAEGLMQRTS